jgi:predicted nucleotidyltransferase
MDKTGGMEKGSGERRMGDKGSTYPKQSEDDILASDSDSGGKENAMTRQNLLRSIRNHESQLRSMGVASLSVFGSSARDEATEDSDVDVLVEFDRPVGYFHVFHVQDFLEELLEGRPVHLVIRDTVIEELREIIYTEAIDVLQ